MKILISIDWFFPAYKGGGPVQSIVNLVNSYKRPGTSFFIFCSDADLGGDKLTNVITDEWTKYREDVFVWYASTKTSNIKSIKKIFADIKPDIIYANGIYSFYYNIVPLLFYNKAKKIVSPRGMLHDGALAQKALKKKMYLLVWKLLGLPQKVIFHASNIDEQAFIEKQFGKETKVKVAFNYPRLFSLQNTNKQQGALDIVSVALISPMKNYLIVIKALASCNSLIYYHIFGPVKDASYWNECVTEIERLPSNVLVHYHGDVPSVAVEESLKKGAVFILPSQSENFGHAFLEAFSAGKPVITSFNTPWKNLEENNAGLNVHINEKSISSAIEFFAGMDALSFEKWKQGAKEYSVRQVDVAAIEKQYDALFTL